ncbi:exodeoxyribonuclease VII small subunit [Thalassiella azotivora]
MTDPASAPPGSSSDEAADERAGDDLEGLTYEQARDELVQVVQRLETGGVALEETLELWERGEALARRCRRWLDGARARLDAAVAAEGD